MEKLWRKMQNEIAELKKRGNYFCYGKSECGEKLWAFKFGKGNKKILVQGATHAREYITTFFLLKLCRYLSNMSLLGTVVICPLANPDGVKLCLCGEKSFVGKNKEIVKEILKNCDNKLIKCNGRGVDINVNFDAHWGGGKRNLFGFPASENYFGKAPSSESETKALVNLVKKFSPDVTISYHSKGEVVYFGFEGKKQSEMDKNLLEIITFESGYKPYKTKNSCGGFKDFCIEKLNIPSFTIEVGNDDLSHPLGLDSLEEIFVQNKDIIPKMLKYLNNGK